MEKTEYRVGIMEQIVSSKKTRTQNEQHFSKLIHIKDIPIKVFSLLVKINPVRVQESLVQS